jgi:hypothetical protein
MFGQKSPSKRADLQILDRDHAEVGHESSGQLVGMVMPEIANPLMLTGEKESSLLSPVRALLPTA